MSDLRLSKPAESDVPEALLRPIPTGQKRIAEYNAALAVLPPPTEEELAAPPKPIEPLDMAALTEKYGGDPGNSSHYLYMHFRVPLGCHRDELQRLVQLHGARWIELLGREGYVVIDVETKPGLYPAVDFDGNQLLDQRFWNMRAHVSLPTARPVEIIIPDTILQPMPRAGKRGRK